MPSFKDYIENPSASSKLETSLPKRVSTVNVHERLSTVKALSNRSPEKHYALRTDGSLPFDFSGQDCSEIVFNLFALPNLKSLKGLPDKVEGIFISNSPLLTKDQLKYLPSTIVNGLYLGCVGITSLEGIGRSYCKSISEILIHPSVTSNILGLMLIHGLKDCTYIIFENHQNEKLELACKIIAKHLARNRDIWACQEEMLDNDLHELAQL